MERWVSDSQWVRGWIAEAWAFGQGRQSDARGPTGTARSGVIFASVPERTRILGVNECGTVISPAATGTGLVSSRHDQRCFALSHVVEWISR